MITDLPDTTASAVDKKLIDLREHAGVTTLGRVLTLIIVTTDGRFDEPLEAAVRASHEHPARMIVLDIDADSADSGLDAEIRLGSDAGSGEVVILRARGDVVTGLDTLLTPLLLPDAPIVAWWPCSPPSAPCQDVVGSLAQRRITDALSAKDPEAVLKRLRRGYSRGDSDMTWSRLTTWRGLIATAYEVPPVSAPTSVVVEGDPANPSVILMAAWLEEMLDTEVRVEENRDGVSGLVAVRLHRED
ncbi:MAG: glucose-6-phosphate dehydrogenase assembly protein OpcA, partial [Brachybacterium sp.]|nr:glucose-6-phosphate dehydrogenase assembly protein OpcA [Brachybacterium sp.]